VLLTRRSLCVSHGASLVLILSYDCVSAQRLEYKAPKSISDLADFFVGITRSTKAWSGYVIMSSLVCSFDGHCFKSCRPDDMLDW